MAAGGCLPQQSSLCCLHACAGSCLSSSLLQAQNYAKRQEDKENREKLFNDALGKFRASDIDGVSTACCAASLGQQAALRLHLSLLH